MEGGTKIIAIVVLIVAVVAFVWWRLSSTEVVGGVKPPPEIRNRTVRMIDEKTLKVREIPNSELKELYNEELAKWKNPDTGEFTMVTVKVCDSCGKEAPRVVFPPSEFEGLSQLEADMKKERMKREAICPHCEGRIYH